MTQPYFCSRCDFETSESISNCPRCGRKLSKTSLIRALGWILVVLGGLLSAGMAWLIFFIANSMSLVGSSSSSTRFTGDAQDALLIFAILGAVLSLSLSFVVAGIWQIIYGRRNKLIIIGVFALAAVVYTLGMFIRWRD